MPFGRPKISVSLDAGVGAVLLDRVRLGLHALLRRRRHAVADAGHLRGPRQLGGVGVERRGTGDAGGAADRVARALAGHLGRELHDRVERHALLGKGGEPAGHGRHGEHAERVGGLDDLERLHLVLAELVVDHLGQLEVPAHEATLAVAVGEVRLDALDVALVVAAAERVGRGARAEGGERDGVVRDAGDAADRLELAVALARALLAGGGLRGVAALLVVRRAACGEHEAARHENGEQAPARPQGPGANGRHEHPLVGVLLRVRTVAPGSARSKDHFGISPRPFAARAHVRADRASLLAMVS
jgi:hypothetical protein